MKKLLTGAVLLILLACGCRTNKPSAEKAASGKETIEKQAEINFSEPSTWLLGYINPVQLSEVPHSEWFMKGFEAYQPDRMVIDRLIELNKDSLSIEIVLGTWCPDSRREVPHFMKILDLLSFPAGNVTFIGVDNSKIAPVGGYDKLEIERVPTFIFLENKVEAGRIIENPVTSLEQDMLNILTRNE